jgi:hypothetical protein
MRAGAHALVVVSAVALAAQVGCDGCKRSEPAGVDMSSPAPITSASGMASSNASVVAESLPRCRVDGARLAIPGDEVVAGDAVTGGDAVLLGVVRREGGRRLASVVRASLDLATVKMLDVGTSLGEDPPPSPRRSGGVAFVASYARAKAGPSTTTSDAGGGAGAIMTRVLEIAKIEGDSLVREGSVVQQGDESLAYDIAWPNEGTGAPLVAWDEDAPPTGLQLLSDRGVVKVQILGAAKPRVASPDATDAEAPRLLARRGGYWLAWLAKRPEPVEDAGVAAEGPGERRAYRWVELVALDAKGEPTSAVRRVTPEKGRVASFDLAATAVEAGAEPRLVVLVQDEAAHADGAGERIVRYFFDGQKDHVESGELLDGGVGHSLAELLGAPGDPHAHAPRWLAFSDTQEHAHLVPLGPSLALAGKATIEPSLDGARIVGSGPAPDVVYAVGSAGAADAAGGRLELRRLICR